MIKIGIVDDHAIVRSGLKQFFSDQVDLRVVGEAGSGREAIDLVRNVELDILVMDLSMPGQSGIDALAMIRAKAPDVGILILSGYPEEHYAVNLIRQGASGYLNKECDPSEIVDAIHYPNGCRVARAAIESAERHGLSRAAFRAGVSGFPEACEGRDRRGYRQSPVA